MLLALGLLLLPLLLLALPSGTTAASPNTKPRLLCPLPCHLQGTLSAHILEAEPGGYSGRTRSALGGIFTVIPDDHPCRCHQGSTIEKKSLNMPQC